MQLSVQSVAKRYGDFYAVSDVSFTANSGEIVGFLGPNGAGKTSTLRMMVTFLPPTAGDITVGGFSVKTKGDEVRKLIGYLPETPPLYPELTVREYLFFVARIKGVEKVKEAVERALENCFLTEVSGKLCGYLSKGYKQRVGIAQAIINDPEVVILDEPTSGLDPKQIIEIRELIKSLGKGKVVVLSTHILPEVSMVCNKVVMINKGKTVLEKNLSELEKSLEETFLECLAGGV
jgi:ABC-2 type transport system ATP-binding protein